MILCSPLEGEPKMPRLACRDVPRMQESGFFGGGASERSGGAFALYPSPKSALQISTPHGEGKI